MSFANRVAVITGASSGIGWELARQLGLEGAKVGLLARRKDKLDELAAHIRQAGGQAAIAAADVTDRGQTVAGIGALREQLGPVDLLIANSGVSFPTRVEPTLNSEQVEHVFRVNVLGVIYAIEAVMPDMLARGSGHLAAISSLGSYKGLPGEGAYCASKAAVNIFMESLRIQLRNRGIAVSTICPGFVKTPMTDANNWSKPGLMSAEEAARRILGALRRRKKVFNFPWRTTRLSKITRFAPDWLLAWILKGQSYDLPPDEPAK